MPRLESTGIAIEEHRSTAGNSPETSSGDTPPMPVFFGPASSLPPLMQPLSPNINQSRNGSRTHRGSTATTIAGGSASGAVAGSAASLLPQSTVGTHSTAPFVDSSNHPQLSISRVMAQTMVMRTDDTHADAPPMEQQPDPQQQQHHRSNAAATSFLIPTSSNSSAAAAAAHHATSSSSSSSSVEDLLAALRAALLPLGISSFEALSDMLAATIPPTITTNSSDDASSSSMKVIQGDAMRSTEGGEEGTGGDGGKAELSTTPVHPSRSSANAHAISVHGNTAPHHTAGPHMNMSRGGNDTADEVTSPASCPVLSTSSSSAVASGGPNRPPSSTTQTNPPPANGTATGSAVTFLGFGSANGSSQPSSLGSDRSTLTLAPPSSSTPIHRSAGSGPPGADHDDGGVYGSLPEVPSMMLPTVNPSDRTDAAPLVAESSSNNNKPVLAKSASSSAKSNNVASVEQLIRQMHNNVSALNESNRSSNNNNHHNGGDTATLTSASSQDTFVGHRNSATMMQSVASTSGVVHPNRRGSHGSTDSANNVDVVVDHAMGMAAVDGDATEEERDRREGADVSESSPPRATLSWSSNHQLQQQQQSLHQTPSDNETDADVNDDERSPQPQTDQQQQSHRSNHRHDDDMHRQQHRLLLQALQAMVVTIMRTVEQQTAAPQQSEQSSSPSLLVSPAVTSFQTGGGNGPVVGSGGSSSFSHKSSPSVLYTPSSILGGSAGVGGLGGVGGPAGGNTSPSHQPQRHLVLSVGGGGAPLSRHGSNLSVASASTSRAGIAAVNNNSGSISLSAVADSGFNASNSPRHMASVSTSVSAAAAVLVQQHQQQLLLQQQGRQLSFQRAPHDATGSSPVVPSLSSAMDSPRFRGGFRGFVASSTSITGVPNANNNNNNLLASSGMSLAAPGAGGAASASFDAMGESVNASVTAPVPTTRYFRSSIAGGMLGSNVMGSIYFGANQSIATASTGGYGGMMAHQVVETSHVVIGRDEDDNKTINGYAIIAEIGRGAYGKVKLAEKIATKELFAIKIVKVNLFGGPSKPAIGAWRKVGRAGGGQGEEGGDGNSLKEKIRREIAVMKKVSHPNLVRLFEVINDANKGKVYLVMQYVPCGTLALKSGPSTVQPIPPSTLRKFAAQIVAALRELHRHGIFHRDIKPDNLLLDDRNNVYVADFGVSVICSEDGVEGVEGTPAFMAPELCKGELLVRGEAVDCWALGVTLYQLMYGFLPFQGETMLQLTRRIVNDDVTFPEERMMITTRRLPASQTSGNSHKSRSSNSSKSTQQRGAPRQGSVSTEDGGGSSHAYPFFQSATDATSTTDNNSSAPQSRLSHTHAHRPSVTVTQSHNQHATSTNHQATVISPEDGDSRETSPTVSSCSSSRPLFQTFRTDDDDDMRSTTIDGAHGAGGSGLHQPAAAEDPNRNVPAEFVDAIRGLLDKDPKQRWTLRKFALCPWLQQGGAATTSANRFTTNSSASTTSEAKRSQTQVIEHRSQQQGGVSFAVGSSSAATTDGTHHSRCAKDERTNPLKTSTTSEVSSRGEASSESGGDVGSDGRGSGNSTPSKRIPSNGDDVAEYAFELESMVPPATAASRPSHHLQDDDDGVSGLHHNLSTDGGHLLADVPSCDAIAAVTTAVISEDLPDADGARLAQRAKLVLDSRDSFVAQRCIIQSAVSDSGESGFSRGSASLTAADAPPQGGGRAPPVDDLMASAAASSSNYFVSGPDGVIGVVASGPDAELVGSMTTFVHGSYNVLPSQQVPPPSSSATPAPSSINLTPKTQAMAAALFRLNASSASVSRAPLTSFHATPVVLTSAQVSMQPQIAFPPPLPPPPLPQHLQRGPSGLALDEFLANGSASALGGLYPPANHHSALPSSPPEPLQPSPPAVGRPGLAARLPQSIASVQQQQQQQQLAPAARVLAVMGHGTVGVVQASGALSTAAPHRPTQQTAAAASSSSNGTHSNNNSSDAQQSQQSSQPQRHTNETTNSWRRRIFDF